jgi:hypothetical protein
LRSGPFTPEKSVLDRFFHRLRQLLLGIGQGAQPMQILLFLAGWSVASTITGLALGRLLRQFGWERD